MELIGREPPEMTLERGFSYIKNGELEKAIAAMNKLIENDPYFAPAYWGRALCIEYKAETQSDAEKAIDDYSRSIVYSEDPQSLSYGRRGILYFKIGKYENALADFDKAVELGGFWAEVLFYRGRTYISLARDAADAERAVLDFGESLKSLGSPFAPAHFWRAQALRLLGREAEAVADYEKAIEIDPDDVLALNALAYCSEHGIGIEKDEERAEELYERAAELGLVTAQKNLAWFYGGAGANERLSTYWMRKAAVSGDAEAQNLYALRRLHGKGTETNPANAAYYFELSSSNGYLPAACNLADCYERGQGVEKDTTRALKIYEDAAEKGSELAKYNVGRYYYFGIGVEEDNDKAFGILKPLADSGHAGAQDIVGMCYENGYGVKRDFKLAGKYFRLAYKQENIHAMAHLAFKYRFGRGVKKSVASAIKLYTRAGEGGLSYAWYALGRLYFEDKCDYDKAEKAFRLAIGAGEEKISLWLARAIMNGKNPKAHIAEAHRLLQDALEKEDDKLVAALFMADIDFLGFCGWPLNQEAAVNRIRDLIPTDGSNPEGLSCAYSFLATAYELGLGTPQNPHKAAGLYMKAGDAGREEKGCRCFAAGMAHMLYQGIGCDKDKESADRIVEDEMRGYGEKANSDIKLLYIWRRMSEGCERETGRLMQIAGEMLREGPYDALAAYMLYRLHIGDKDEGKYLRRLKKILKTASPYHRFMVEQGLLNTAETIYPLLTYDLIKQFEAAHA